MVYGYSYPAYNPTHLQPSLMAKVMCTWTARFSMRVRIGSFCSQPDADLQSYWLYNVIGLIPNCGLCDWIKQTRRLVDQSTV